MRRRISLPAVQPSQSSAWPPAGAGRTTSPTNGKKKPTGATSCCGGRQPALLVVKSIQILRQRASESYAVAVCPDRSQSQYADSASGEVCRLQGRNKTLRRAGSRVRSSHTEASERLSHFSQIYEL